MPLYGLNIKGTLLLQAVGDRDSINSLKTAKHKVIELKNIPGYTRVYMGGKSYSASVFQRAGKLISDEVYYINPIGVNHDSSREEIIKDFSI